MKPGDLVWQRRFPGGVCLLIKVFDDPGQYDRDIKEYWADHDYPIWRVVHPTEGLIDDPSYYYDEEIECNQEPA